MTDLRTVAPDKEYENQISDIIQGELIGLYGTNGYKSIMQTMTRISGKCEREIITNFELFAGLSDGVFGSVRVKNFRSDKNENRNHRN